MTRRQEKIAKRNAEYREFMFQRRTKQIAILQANFDVGMQLYEKGKETLPPEEIALIEEEIKKNEELLDNLKKEAEKFAFNVDLQS